MSNEIIQVAPMDVNRKNSELTDKLSGERTVILGNDKPKCIWNDENYEEGSVVCDSGTAYKCHMGLWIKESDNC